MPTDYPIFNGTETITRAALSPVSSARRALQAHPDVARFMRLALVMLLTAPAHVSRAFDPPHTISPRTWLVKEVQLTMITLYIVVCLMLWAWGLRRREKHRV